MVKTISFIGNKYEDLVHYLSRILIALNKKICIIDLSREQLFKYTLPAFEGDFYCYRDADIYMNTTSFDDLENNYDVALMLLGYSPTYKEVFTKSDVRILSTDFTRANILRVKEFLDDLNPMEQLGLIKIYRDLIATKINEKYIDTLLTFDNISFPKEYAIYFDDEIAATSLLMQYNDVFKFDKLNKEYKEVVYDLMNDYFPIEKKELKKAYKRAERGK